MLLGLLLLAATPVDAAERAFAAQAQRDGQWTAFRAFAADDAVMFAPGKVDAHAFLAPLKNPPSAVMWWPARSIAACDGSLAISTGPWIRKGGGQRGTFTTVWRHQADGGWKWLYDNGRETPDPVGAGETVKASRASCVRIARPPLPALSTGTTSLAALLATAADDVLVQLEGRMPAGKADAAPLALKIGAAVAGGRSADGTLIWDVQALEGAGEGAHLLTVRRFDGHGFPAALIEVSGVKPS